MANGNGDGFTPTQQRIMDILADSAPHLDSQLIDQLYDPGDGKEKPTLYQHLYLLRKKLRQRGEDISCHTVAGRTYYQSVRLLASPYRE